MSDKIEKILKSVSCTFVVLVFVSLALFFGRFFCDTFLFKRTFEEYKWRDLSSIKIRPSGLLPDNIENDPNVKSHSAIRGEIDSGRNPNIGIFDYFRQRVIDREIIHLVSSRYYSKAVTEAIYFTASIYFDEVSGLIVYSFVVTGAQDNKKNGERIELFAGPEGISDRPSKELGRFYDPIGGSFFTYDKRLCRFFKIDFKVRKVTKGPELAKDKGIRPVQVGDLIKGGNSDRDSFCSCWFTEPMKLKYPEGDKTELVSIGILELPWKVQYGLVLDESGEIFLLDSRTLEIAGKAGCLPAPETFFYSGDSVRPKDLLCYKVEPVSIKPDGRYCGMVVSSLSREGTSLVVAIFDKDGRLIKKENTAIDFKLFREKYGLNIYDSKMPTSRVVFWGRPWSPFVTVIRYLLENLQGPALSAATFVTADSFEAQSGYSALFVLPNSFIGMKGRQADETLRYKVLTGLALIFPSIFLSIFLAKAINKDAKERGLSEKEKRWWIIAVWCLGIVGFISYCLCKEEVGLVTCQNCGKDRRVDSETCHRCGSGWVVPELQEPLWRVKES